MRIRTTIDKVKLGQSFWWEGYECRLIDNNDGRIKNLQKPFIVLDSGYLYEACHNINIEIDVKTFGEVPMGEIFYIANEQHIKCNTVDSSGNEKIFQDSQVID